jgi:hypothetical protein
MSRQKKEVKTPHGILASLYKQILAETIGEGREVDLLTRYITTQKKLGLKKISNTDALKKELLAPTMSFNNFVKLLRLLNQVDKIHIRLELDYMDGKTSIHEKEIDLKNVDL